MKTAPQRTGRSSNIRVVHLGKYYPPQHGGIESHTRTLCESLSPHVDVEAIVSNTNMATIRERCEGVLVTRLGRLAQIRSTPLNPSLLSTLRSTPADLVHLHWPNPMAAVAYLSSRHRGRLIVSYHSDVLAQPLLGRLMSPVLHALLHRADAILVSSEQSLASSPVLSRWKPKCQVVPLGLAAEHFLSPDKQALQEVIRAHGEHFILAAGRLVSYKGFDHLLRAMVHIPSKLLIAGDGPLRAKLTRLSTLLELQQRVVFLGQVSDDRLRALYHGASLFVLASTDRRESFGLVQAEAMAASTPVINTALDSGVPTVSLHGVTGLTVPPADVVALVHAMRLLLDDPVLRASFGRNARKEAERRFSTHSMTDQILEIYGQVLHKSLQTRLGVESAATTVPLACLQDQNVLSAEVRQ